MIDAHFSETLKDIIMDNLYIGVYFTDEKGKTLYVNKTFEEMSLIKAKELVGKTLEELVKQKYFTASATLLVIKTKKPAAVTYITKTNKKLLARGKPFFDQNGNLKYVVNTVYDLSEVHYMGDIDYDSRYNDKNSQIIAFSSQMVSIVDFALRVANVDSTVLITGESGVGKEVVARLIHDASPRKNHPFVKVNCAAIPENLMETELFGYEGGAFTGSHPKGKKGFFEASQKGTLFLDEIGELPLNVQAKLLQVLQDKQFTRVGSTQLINVDVRIIAATNRNLKEMIDKKQFREDLYYRLNVIPIFIPPLRERRDDIEPLINYIVNRVNNKYNFNKQLELDLIDLFKSLPWKGNIRELENVIEKLLIVTPKNLITKSDYLIENTQQLNINPKLILKNYEKELLLSLLPVCKNTRELAKKYGVSQSTIVRKLKHYGISIQ
ncbi:MAG: sigma-54 interaction domain-containing protein [Desulfurella sp.]|jgi:TyrR family helix-turn-helix protein/PAS domain S-box-containing protein